MPDKIEQFKHIRLSRTKTGIAGSRGYRRSSPRTDANKGNRQGHGNKLMSSASSVVSSWQSTLEKRKQEGMPDIPNAPSFLLQIDTDSFDADDLKTYGVEVILELEDGYILGASADVELTNLQKKIAKFIENEHGGGNVAGLLEILEGRLQRLEYILSSDLLAQWDQILDDHIYTVDVSIACVGLNPKFPEPRRQRDNESDEEYAEIFAKWINNRDQTSQKWDELQLRRENEFEDFVKKLDGIFLSLGDYDDRSHLALLPDSFSSRVEISGKGLKDLVVNYPYIFDVSEPDVVHKPLTRPSDTKITQPSFTLEKPSIFAPKVCVIDSGIQENHRFLRAAMDSEHSRSWVPSETNQTMDRVSGGGHGTRVAGAILYSQKVPSAGRKEAICWLQNARILDRNNSLSEKLYIPKVLNEIVEFYHAQTDTRIFNHSISSSAPCRKNYMSAWAAEIDYLTWQKDLLFIVSAGNLPTKRLSGLSVTRNTLAEHFEEGCSYPDFLLQDSSRIANPAQSFQALTVGSIAHSTYSQPPLTSVASKDHPSAFSCTGYGIWDSIKPEVVEYGGDWVRDEGNPPSFSTPENVCPELVRTTLGGAPAIAADTIGTSFAAPKVTHIAVALAANFPQESCLLYKALIVQSARLPAWVDQEDVELSTAIRMMGYGLPNLERALGNTPHRITLITSEDKLIKARQADIYQVIIPDELQSPAEEFDILIEITLSYKAEPRRTRRNKRKYLSTWLHWECSKKGESPDVFFGRVLEQYEVSDNQEEGSGFFDWTLRRRKDWGRAKDISREVGTTQKDWAIVKSFDLREAFCIAVVGHKGWNNDPTAEVPYALTISFEIVNSEIAIYNSFVQAQTSLQVVQQIQV